MRMGARTARSRMVLGIASAGLLLTVAACSGTGGSATSHGDPGAVVSGGGQTSGGQGTGGQVPGGNSAAAPGAGAGTGNGASTGTGASTDQGTHPGSAPTSTPGTTPATTPGPPPGTSPGADPGRNPGTYPGSDGGTDAKKAPRFAPGGVDPSISREAESGTGTGGKTIALTIDDGPDPRYTPQMLDILKQHNAKATFCMLGPAAKAHPDLVKRVVAEGHRLCNHSMSHNVRQSDRSADYNRHEITEADRLIREAAGPGAKVWYYRAPGGDFTPWIREMAVENGLRPLGWNVDPGDWKREGADKILASLEQQIRPGRVVLVHDGGGDRSQSVTALKGLLEHLDAEGYTYSFPKS
ncbi:polysaccharide deacetylase family protein [Streptodolium elevatio]|uniref:Polysaccharide deacetylase family protein n=1 Tax=Streptodolium elevatio TaxID=3157996 RepID=A0ABV3DUK0_9ACTN